MFHVEQFYYIYFFSRVINRKKVYICTDRVLTFVNQIVRCAHFAHTLRTLARTYKSQFFAYTLAHTFVQKVYGFNALIYSGFAQNRTNAHLKPNLLIYLKKFFHENSSRNMK